MGGGIEVPNSRFYIRPNISAIKNGTSIIAEVETGDSILWDETIDQWRAFDRSNSQFHVVVPKSCYPQAVNQAKFHNITVDNWWIANDL